MKLSEWGHSRLRLSREEFIKGHMRIVATEPRTDGSWWYIILDDDKDESGFDGCLLELVERPARETVPTYTRESHLRYLLREKGYQSEDVEMCLQYYAANKHRFLEYPYFFFSCKKVIQEWEASNRAA